MLLEPADSEVEERFNRLYEKTVRHTTAYLMPRCRRASDVEDLLQETYLELFRALNRPGLTTKLRSGEALVRQIAKQRLYRYYRRPESQEEIPLLLSVGDEEESYLDFSDISQLEVFLGEHPEDQEFDRRIMEEIQSSLRKAREIDRQIVAMRYGLELSLQEIATALDCPVSTIKSRLYRFLNKLREAQKDRR